jgi:hypothetical protein
VPLGWERPRPCQNEWDDDQPAGDVAQPPAAPEDAQLGRIEGARRVEREHRDCGADRRAGGNRDNHRADVLQAVECGARASQPPEDRHRHDGPCHVSRRLRESDPGRELKLDRQHIPKQAAEIT